MSPLLADLLLALLVDGHAVSDPNCNSRTPSVTTEARVAPDDIPLGSKVFERNCVPCHGVGGAGGRGPSLTRAHLARAEDDIALGALIQSGIPPEMPGGTFLTPADVSALVKYVRMLGRQPGATISGSPESGAKVFVKSGCMGCHIFRGSGVGIGPELTNEGSRRSAAYVRQVVLQPEQNLPADFLVVRLVTLRGEALRGIRVNEDTYSIQIKDMTGAFHSFRKEDLRSLEKLEGQTPMPPFQGVIPDSELNDLVAYLLQAPR